MPTPPLHITAPHGAQAVKHTEKPAMRAGQSVGNQLFTLYTVTDDLDRVTLTGEELDSLTAWWAAYREQRHD